MEAVEEMRKRAVGLGVVLGRGALVAVGSESLGHTAMRPPERG